MLQDETYKYITVQDSYHYYGFWANGMMEILPDKQLKNIIRGETEGAKRVLNFANSCSTRDTIDIDLYVVDREDNLVYFEEDKVKEIKDGRYILNDHPEVVLTFCKASEHLKDEVVERLCKERSYIKENMQIKTKDTFILDKQEVISLVEQFYGDGNSFNPDTCEYDGHSLLSDDAAW